MAYIYMPYSMPFPVPGQNGLKGFLKVLLEHTWHFQITNAACDRLVFLQALWDLQTYCFRPLDKNLNWWGSDVLIRGTLNTISQMDYE